MNDRKFTSADYWYQYCLGNYTSPLYKKWKGKSKKKNRHKFYSRWR